MNTITPLRGGKEDFYLKLNAILNHQTIVEVNEMMVQLQKLHSIKSVLLQGVKRQKKKKKIPKLQQLKKKAKEYV